jgi:hypothetical protein
LIIVKEGAIEEIATSARRNLKREFNNGRVVEDDEEEVEDFVGMSKTGERSSNEKEKGTERIGVETEGWTEEASANAEANQKRIGSEVDLREKERVRIARMVISVETLPW